MTHLFIIIILLLYCSKDHSAVRYSARSLNRTLKLHYRYLPFFRQVHADATVTVSLGGLKAAVLKAEVLV